MSIDWDAWRANHPNMTFDDNQRHHDEVYRLHPEQEHHHAEWVAEFISRYAPNYISELGGWRGELAAKMLDRFDFIRSWHNFDICRPAIENSVVRDDRYHGFVLDEPFWNELIFADAFVAAHVIEHLSPEEFASLARSLRTVHAYLEAPLLERGQTWAGYIGNHINTMTWEDVHSVMAENGYVLEEFKHVGDTGCAFYRYN